MSYQVLARKYRPQKFSEVIGQDHVTRTLKNAIEQGRTAHGYIFSGHRGIGKTTIDKVEAVYTDMQLATEESVSLWSALERCATDGTATPARASATGGACATTPRPHTRARYNSADWRPIRADSAARRAP